MLSIGGFTSRKDEDEESVRYIGHDVDDRKEDVLNGKAKEEEK